MKQFFQTWMGHRKERFEVTTEKPLWPRNFMSNCISHLVSYNRNPTSSWYRDIIANPNKPENAETTNSKISLDLILTWSEYFWIQNGEAHKFSDEGNSRRLGDAFGGNADGCLYFCRSKHGCRIRQGVCRFKSHKLSVLGTNWRVRGKPKIYARKLQKILRPMPVRRWNRN